VVSNAVDIILALDVVAVCCAGIMSSAKDGIDIAKWEFKPGARPATYDGCMVEGCSSTPLSELLEADEAKRAKLELIALRLYPGKKSFAGRRYGCLVVLILCVHGRSVQVCGCGHACAKSCLRRRGP
jgi:hypothetical protein